MEELESENLRALLNGGKLNASQLFNANREYKKIILFAYNQEREVQQLKNKDMNTTTMKKDVINILDSSPAINDIFNTLYEAGIKKGLEEQSTSSGVSEILKEFESIKKMNASPGTQGFMYEAQLEKLKTIFKD